MEQKQLSQGAIIQIAGSVLILLSVFLAWFSIQGFVSLSLMQTCELIGQTNKDVGGLVAIIPYVLIILTLANIVFVFLKGKKPISVALAIFTILTCIAAIVDKVVEDKHGEISFGIGFFLAIVGIVVLFVGMSKKDEVKKEPAVKEEAQA